MWGLYSVSMYLKEELAWVTGKQLWLIDSYPTKKLNNKAA